MLHHIALKQLGTYYSLQGLHDKQNKADSLKVASLKKQSGYSAFLKEALRVLANNGLVVSALGLPIQTVTSYYSACREESE